MAQHRLSRRAVSLVLVALVAACAARPSADRPVWDSSDARWIDAGALVARLARADIVMLGEVHDAASHHEIQEQLLRGLIARGRRPAVAFEQFDTERQPALDAARGAVRSPADALAQAERVADAGGLERRAWDWPAYRPLVADALANDLPILAANVSRDVARRVMREGFAALGAERPPSLDEAHLPIAPAQLRAMRDQIEQSHCGMLDVETAGHMVRAQLARDAVMGAVVAAHASRGAVLIAGNQHVRRDVGAPAYLPAPLRARTVTVGLVEGDPASAARFGRVYDYVWATPPPPAGVRPDPCAGFNPPAGTRAPLR